MIIGISGEIGAGKDTVGKIIQYLTVPREHEHKDYEIVEALKYNEGIPNYVTWQIHKFAGALKDIICILTGCTREQLEDINFKNGKLPDEWIRYGYADGFFKYYKNGKEETKMNNVQCSKERYDLEYRTNWQTAYKVHPTYRELLQYLGTDLLRNQFHEDVWINALMNKYKPKICSGSAHCALAGKPEISCNKCPEYPNWIITDVRFENEAKAIKDRDGIVIRIDRTINYNPDGAGIKEIIERHSSETSLNNYLFDYIIDNNGTIDELINQVKQILIKENII